MSDLQSVILHYAVTITHKTRAQGLINDTGDYIEGAETSTDILGAIMPISGSDLRDMPEGTRVEAVYSLWTVTPVNNDDVISHGGVDYRVIHVWPRHLGGYTKSTLGCLA